MDFEQELNQMIDAMTAQINRYPDRIIMHPDTARSMALHTNDLAGGGWAGDVGIARYNCIPIILGTYDSGYDARWIQQPYRSSTTAEYIPPKWQQERSVSFKIDTYEAKKPDEEPDEIDESSFLDILNAGG